MDKSADQENHKTTAMSPKNKYDPSNNTSGNVEDGDLEEMADVSETIDELTNALDFFERRTDNIMEQLRDLLNSNREIRQELEREKEAAIQQDPSDRGDAAEDQSMQ